MAAPTTWGTPSSGAQVASSFTPLVTITYAGGYWFAITRPSGTSVITLRYATDPSGTWATATLPAVPPGYTGLQTPGDSGVTYGNGVWALHVRYSNGSVNKGRIVHTTDPTGSWSAHEYDSSDLYRGASLAYGDGVWAVSGRYLSGSPNPGFIGYCSTVDGTYTFNTGSSAIGYDASVTTDVRCIAYDGTTWVTTASRSGGADGVLHSTSLTSGWASPTITAISGAALSVLRVQPGGYWTVTQYANADNTNNGFFYATSPSGTWTFIDGFGEGFDSVYPVVASYSSSAWVLAGAEEYVSGNYEPQLAYLEGASPSGAYTAITSPFTTAAADIVARSVAGSGSAFVAATDHYGELRYCLVPATGPTLLRQRQSPLRTPARVRGVDLRQRQTPYIT